MITSHGNGMMKVLLLQWKRRTDASVTLRATIGANVGSLHLLAGNEDHYQESCCHHLKQTENISAFVFLEVFTNNNKSLMILERIISGSLKTPQPLI